jgi:hypothetical protein
MDERGTLACELGIAETDVPALLASIDDAGTSLP